MKCAREGCVKQAVKRGKFCSRSCSASHNNKGVRRHKKSLPNCLNCRKVLSLLSRKYCNNHCQHKHQRNEYIKRWLDGEEDGTRGGALGVSAHIRNWCIERCQGRCEICGLDEWMGKPMPLVLDHKDGNGMNNRPPNLRMICGNCDMQLPTFAGRNRGNGRVARKKHDDRRTKILRKPS